MPAMLTQEIMSQVCHGNEDSYTLLMVALNETTFIGFLPDRKTGA